MKLLIDIGNTTTKLGWTENNKIIESRILHTNPAETVDELWSRWTSVLDYPLKKATWVIASVVPECTESIRRMTHRRNIKTDFFEAPWDNLDLKVETDTPASVGADRLAGALAFTKKYGTGAVVDFGTATTVDWISPEGSYRGGVILPGVEAGSHGLAHKTALLPRIPPRPPEEFLYQNTRDSLQTGLFYGMAGAVDRIVKELSESNGPDYPSVVATGGAGKPFVELSQVIEHYEPELVLEGLLLYAN